VTSEYFVSIAEVSFLKKPKRPIMTRAEAYGGRRMRTEKAQPMKYRVMKKYRIPSIKTNTVLNAPESLLRPPTPMKMTMTSKTNAIKVIRA